MSAHFNGIEYVYSVIKPSDYGLWFHRRRQRTAYKTGNMLIAYLNDNSSNRYYKRKETGRYFCVYSIFFFGAVVYETDEY